MKPISVELFVLLLTAVWTVLLVVPPFVARSLSPKGLVWGLSNRDSHFQNAKPWYGRAIRAHLNMLENLAPFAVLVIVAHLTGVQNEWTMWAAIGFLAMRVLHAICYIGGLTPWRTHAFNLSLICLAVFVIQIFLHTTIT